MWHVGMADPVSLSLLADFSTLSFFPFRPLACTLSAEAL